MGAFYDPGEWINANDNGFVVVEIQYRLGAFGFLASPDVKKHGQLNAGLLDQRLSFKWVQKYISQFGGDPGQVTIAGQSAGAGSVMFHALAYGGKGEKLFENVGDLTLATHGCSDMLTMSRSLRPARTSQPRTTTLTRCR